MYLFFLTEWTTFSLRLEVTGDLISTFTTRLHSLLTGRQEIHRSNLAPIQFIDKTSKIPQVQLHVLIWSKHCVHHVFSSMLLYSVNLPHFSTDSTILMSHFFFSAPNKDELFREIESTMITYCHDRKHFSHLTFKIYYNAGGKLLSQIADSRGSSISFGFTFCEWLGNSFL